ncbi:MAG: PAS domain-containing protein [Acetobacteraceae bacterium]
MTQARESVRFLSESGEMAERMRRFDWSQSPLGPASDWPHSLRTVVSLMLHARQPMFVAWGADMTFLYNDAYALVLGAKHPNALGRPFAVVWSDIWPQFGPIVDRVMSGEALAYDDLPIPMMRNGYLEDTWFSFSYTPLHDDDGDIAGIFCACNETTAKVRTEEVLRASEAQLALERARLDALFRHLPVGVNFIDETGQTLLCNPAFRAYVPEGVVPSATEDTASRWIAFDAQGNRLPRDQYPAARALRGKDKAEVDFIYQPPCGPAKWTRVSAVPLLDPSGTITGALATVVDIDAERQAQMSLQRLNETLEQRIEETLAERNLWADIFATTDSFIMAIDFDYRLLAINQASSDEFESIHGIRLNVGDNLLDRLSGQPDQQALIRDLWAPVLAGEERTVTGEFGSPGRRRRHYEIKFSHLRNRRGERIGAFHYAVDVTERALNQARLAEAQEQLRQSQKMEAVGQLTGGIAHDFNNLLTGISGSLEIMQRRIQQGRISDVDRFVKAAMTGVERAAALTHRLLAFSRRQPLEPKSVDVNRLVASLNELLRRTIGEMIRLELDLSAGVWPTLCDPNQLENALLNLAINARDAMPDGGRLTIGTSNVSFSSTITTSTGGLEPGEYALICVTDTGCGMPPDVIERAFEPFFTTKPTGQGTGLGLSMIYGFIRQSKGHATIDSAIGKGTTVKLYLPRHHGDDLDAAIQPRADAEPARVRSGETVLVVEDEEAVRNLVVEVLSDLGCRTIQAVDGPTGLDVVESGQHLDLLVTDVGLPGLNGRQLADAARAARPGLKVLFMTGYAENAVFDHDLLGDGMEMMTKPFSIKTLANRIGRMIERR